MKNKAARLLIIGGIAIFVVIFPIWAQNKLDPYILRLLKLIIINIILAEAVNLVNGISGQFSLGHQGFVLVGAYTYALLSLPIAIKARYWIYAPLIWPFNSIQLHFLPSLICAGLVAGIVGFIVGIPAFRFRGDYLSIVTLAFGEIMLLLASNLIPLTNGPIGIKGIPDQFKLTWIWGLMVLTLIFVSRLAKSAFGRALKCIRRDERAAEVMGVRLFYHKIVTFSLGAAIAGLAGAAIANLFGNIDPSQFSLAFMFQLLLIVVVGGLGSIAGSLIAAPFITGFLEWARIFDSGAHIGSIRLPSMPGLRMAMLSALFIAVMIYSKGGLLGSKTLSWGFLASAAKRVRNRLRGESERKDHI